MAETHRSGALAKMREHHDEAVRLRTSDPAASRAAAKRATHAADVVKSIDAGRPVGTVDASKDFSKGSPVRTSSAITPIPEVGTFARSRGGYDPDTSVDYTNTNPGYWSSVVSYFEAHPKGNPLTGELGIWIPNLEKEGAERTALAAIAGGVTAHVDSNYSNRTVSDAGNSNPRVGAIYAGKTATESYRGGPLEKAIRLAGTHRGGTEVTGPGIGPMGSTAPSEHGVYIKGGVVTKGAGVDYVKGGGDFGGLLGVGDSITGDWLTGVLGGMDKDGMRLGGTYAPVRGATGSGVGAGGTKTSIGGLYAGGTDPLASMPKVADMTGYVDRNSIFGGLSDNAAVRKGLLYQTMADNYGAEMEAAGLPAFSPGLLGSFTSAGGPTYGSAPSDFMKPKAGATGTGTSSTMIGSPSAKYALPEMYGDYKFSRIPTFYDLAALESAGDVWRSRGGAWKGSPWVYEQPALVGGHKLYTTSGSEGDWELKRSYPLAETTT